MNINLATDPNSTIVEHKLHKALFADATWDENEIYEHNSEAFKPEAPQPPPVQHQRTHLKCLNVRVFINCVGLEKEMTQLGGQKLFHELQFDQISLILGKQTLGFTMLLNYFSRVHAHFDHKQSCVIHFRQEVLMPWQRHNQHLLLRVGRMLMHPVSFHKALDRVNLI